jgi:hypothetical protein
LAYPTVAIMAEQTSEGASFFVVVDTESIFASAVKKPIAIERL